MSTAIRVFVVAAIAALLTYLTWPWLKNALYLSELITEEPPRTLPVPVQGVSMRAVRDTFGAPRPGDRTHQGIDIFAPRGTPVSSTTRGISPGVMRIVVRVSASGPGTTAPSCRTTRRGGGAFPALTTYVRGGYAGSGR